MYKPAVDIQIRSKLWISFSIQLNIVLLKLRVWEMWEQDIKIIIPLIL